jgi:4-alpha-glucanotransferase
LISRPQTPSFAEGRHAGVLLPLFSCPSTRSWGIGEITDLPIVARWLRAAGLDLIQMLPVNEMAFGQTSPYSALSAMAIDPLYISLDGVPEFEMLGGEASLSAETRARLDSVRRSPGVAYADVRSIKAEALRATYAKFAGMGHGSARRPRPRVAAFEKFRTESRWWLEDYALFRALHERHEHRAWWTWDRALQAREPAALDRVRAELADEIRYYEFLQWLAADQWRAAREASAPVGFFGDLPFMVGADSADVWANQEMFARDLSVGTPPDAFSATGQDWGLPAYRWEPVAASNFRWLRDRARRARELFDGFRVDHVIGFYRTYVRPIPLPEDAANGTPEGAFPAAESAESADAAAAAVSKAFFTPAEEHQQRALGEHIIGVFRESGAYIIAEDLGTVPDFVRESLERLQVPGYRVLRWEREWHQPGQPFRDPAHYPARSLATTGTHDTDPLAIAWDDAPPDERGAIAALAGLSGGGPENRGAADREFDNDVRDALLKLLYASGSDLLVIPIQDLFGWRDRINTPATVGDTNWTWRLPWPADRLDDEPEAHERAATLREWAASTNRSSALLASHD